MRTAVDNDGPQDKEAISYNDRFDAFRLGLKFYHLREKDDYRETTFSPHVLICY